MNKIILGDCLEKLKELEDNSVDSIVTDPPYELGFMGKSWDNTGIANNVDMWKECLRVLKPGGHLLAFSGTRTYHRMASAIEDAGFEVRDMIEWVMGSGFPKSLNIFKQLEKRCDCGIMKEYGERTTKNTKHYLRPLQEADIQKAKHLTEEQRETLFKGLPKQNLPIEKEVREGLFISERAGEPSMEGRCYLFQKEGELYRCAVCQMSAGVFSDGEKGWLYNGAPTCNGNTHGQAFNKDGSSASREPQSERQQDREPCAFCKQFGTQAIRAFGWGSAMKPAHEPICVARKPLSEANISDNFLKWGTGGINIDESRVETQGKDLERLNSEWDREWNTNYSDYADKVGGSAGFNMDKAKKENAGLTDRFPANLIHDNSEEVRECFPSPHPAHTQIRKSTDDKDGQLWNLKRKGGIKSSFGDSGNASRFFKSIIYQAKASKSERNKGMDELEEKEWKQENSPNPNREDRPFLPVKNNHPTVKPIALMEYLIKMVTPKCGIVLDPFAGSFSTGVACVKNGFGFVGIEREEEYVVIGKARLEQAQKERDEELKVELNLFNQ